MQLFINRLAVVFHPEIDQRNKNYTIAFSPKTREILKINPVGYSILKIIGQRPGLTKEQVAEGLPAISYLQLTNFLEKMVKNDVILSDD